MTNGASTSNQSVTVNVNEAYTNPSHVIGPNFVTVKLSGKSQYNLWRIQMECLLKSQHMVDFIKGAENGKGKGKVGDRAMEASDSLVKGWILGSLSEDAARKAVNHLIHMQKKTDFTAKDLWDELQRSYETKSPTRRTESVIEVISVNEDAKSKDEPEEEKERKKTMSKFFNVDDLKKSFHKSIVKEDIRGTMSFYLLGLRPWDTITNNGNTALHVAVAGTGKKNDEILSLLLGFTLQEKKSLIDLVNSDGSTLLHVAAIGGNIKAVNVLVQCNPKLLLAKDKEGHTPLALSISNMHTNTSHCLFEHMKGCRYRLEEKEKKYDALLRGEVIMTCKTFEQDEKEKKYGALNTGKRGKDIKTSKRLLKQQRKEYDALFSGQSGEDLVVLAISCQDFRLANMIINDYPNAVLLDSDAVLMALAQNFPRELNFWERRDVEEDEVRDIFGPYEYTFHRLEDYLDLSRGRRPLKKFILIIFVILLIGFFMVEMIFRIFLKASVFLFFEESQIHKYARNLLVGVCYKISQKDNLSTYHEYYTNSIFEATRRNASTFIRLVMRRFPDAISSTNEDGHNFIQYSVINRSEKIYNLLYEMSEHKNIYKTIKDSSGNNLLHLAARLAPTNKLNLISGAALQIQRELQWFKEVEQFVCPLNRIQKNLDEETPQEVFTRAHKDLVIEGENWIKKTAESYTITAALIITIVFASAITVPGGNNQESGVPIFTNNIAFTVFAISNAVSLFTAVTSLLLFLSILTARFAEQDFLLKLPTKLIIGLTMLFLSTTAMIIAFGATLFLMFGQGNSSMLIPIGALTCLPITSFVTLQFPLIVELIRATYCGGFFVREKYDYFC